MLKKTKQSNSQVVKDIINFQSNSILPKGNLDEFDHPGINGSSGFF